MRRWQSCLNVILGLWVMTSPWVLGFSMAPGATWTTAVLGAAILVFAGTAAFEPRTWEEAVTVALGVAVMVSPWVLGFAPGLGPATSAEIAGVLVSALGLWAMVDKPDVVAWRQHKRTNVR